MNWTQEMDEMQLLLNGLRRIGAPTILCTILVLLQTYPGLTFKCAVDFVEYFAGVEAVTKGMLNEGYTAVGYEILKNPKMMDFCSSNGYVLALYLVTQPN